jgi:hypothetical protein
VNSSTDHSQQSTADLLELQNLPNQPISDSKSASKKVYADFHGKDPQIDPLLKNPLRNFSPLRRC